MASAFPSTRSQLDEQLFKAGLDVDYWGEILKTKLNITLLQQIQRLDETDLEVLKAFMRGEREEENVRTFLGIKSGKTSNQPAEYGKQKIEAVLPKTVDVSSRRVIEASGEFLDILKTLGLEKYYPSKISLLQAMVIKNAPGNLEPIDLPWTIIHKLLMIDFHARDQPLAVVNKSSREARPDDEEDFDLEDILLDMQITSSSEGNARHLNTLDVLVTIFACCDNILKRTLAQKLFVCKLAIPFLYPLGSESSIGMSLWALRTINVQWQSKEKEASETPVTDESFPIVTFVRLGRPPFSKAKLMNDILRDDSHDTFFNHDCNNGTVTRKITDGLVECSWFITAGKEKEHLPGTTMLLNLRGDASKMQKQMQILQEISSVLFVTVTAKDLATTPYTETCQQVLKTSAKVILCLISGNKKQSNQERGVDLQACFKAVGRDSLKGVPIILSNTRQGVQKNASELKTEARGKLSEAIAGCSGLLLEDCARRAKKMGIIVDEFDDGACLKGRALAKKITSHMEGKKIVDCKQLLLPLQGVEWFEYCKLLKKQHRTSGKGTQTSSAEHADKIKEQMDSRRANQVDICNSLGPFIQEFMSTLQENPDVVMYFLEWMKLSLDKTSRANLPGLRRKYHEVWTKFQEAKKKEGTANMQRLQSKVDDAENNLASASFGLENLFRELGQIYEAVKGSVEIGKDTRVDVEYLPKIAAKLLLKGRPLELVDGDASSVPIAWVNAVLKMVENELSSKRLFVLSVLGIQSSGKSTLLNTMFGLQFAVSAGRCTRGAYMQLVPVDKHANLPFDYVVVVDTEGLRAPELGQLKYEHDNELATLAIGIGDATVINIKGENTAEMKDILQIVIHAFLRMSSVTKHIRDHRTCIFVHQNVPVANNEKELMMHGSQKLQENLDDMVKEAASNEKIANIHSFSQIINFDVKKHVWYLSDLWHGNPPMAPANPGYSEKVEEVRLNLLEKIGKRQTTFLTTSDLSLRISDLWKGVLADDFVFSFRNSLEVKAYNSLQSEYYALEWQLDDKMKSWLHDAGIKLKICETIDDLKDTFNSLIDELSKVLREKVQEIKNSLEKFFKNSNLQDIVIQWQQSQMIQLNFAETQKKNENASDLLLIKEARQMEILQSKKWFKHETTIMNKAVELANELKGEEASDDDLKERFEKMWESMLHELDIKIADKELKMDKEMEEILRQKFHDQGTILSRELKTSPLYIPLEQTSLECSINADDVTAAHISLKGQSVWGSVKGQLSGTNYPGLQARRDTVTLTVSILKEIGTYLKFLSNQDLNFQKTHAKKVVHTLVEKIDKHNNSEKFGFTILPVYVVKVAVHVSRYCVQVFSLMQYEYNSKHGVKSKLQHYKNTAWDLFKIMVKQSTEEVKAGDLICKQLMGIIEKEVKKEIPRKCIGEILAQLQMTKYYLMMKMLDDLAEKEEFNEYISYIENAKMFASRWITKYTDEEMFSKQTITGMTRYAEIAKSHISRIIRSITKSVEIANAKMKSQTSPMMTLWINRFCQGVSDEIPVPVSTLKIVNARSVKDFNNLQNIILEQLDRFEKKLMKDFANETKETVHWDGTPPAQQIIDKIWGCPDQCPFCGEPCADTTPNHYELHGRSHRCVQHRPKGIAGTNWAKESDNDGVRIQAKQLVHETCNFGVQAEGASFSCKFGNYKCRDSGCSTTGEDYVYHKYIEYKTYMPDWDIPPDPTNGVSKYWMWFMATYKEDLRDEYSAILPDIPNTWHNVTKKEALDDLRKIHR